MSDIALILKDNCFDLGITGDDLTPDNGLETAVTISLFTDKRVTDEELPFPETNKRGWWGDMFPEIDQDQIGSRVWTLDRSKILNETLNRMNELCKESLNWMIEDGIAGEIAISSEYNESKHMITTVNISRPDEATERFSVLWDEQELRRI